MGKDPAMLWYWSDWHSGTTTLSRFLKGCYMDVLHAQFNSGHLSLEEIKTVLGSDFGQAWPVIQKKFTVDEAGKYFNKRLEDEQRKRAAYTASRRKNLESAHMEDHMDKHMGTHMENINVNDIEIVGIKKEWWVTVKRTTAKGKHKMIYDLQLYFEHMGQLEAFNRAGFDQYEQFMKTNPSRIFNDPNHLYNAFRKFHVEGQLKKLAGSKKKLTLEDIDQ